MAFTLNAQNILLAGIGLHLLGGLAKTIFHTPRQQAQIDAIESKVDAVLGAVRQGIAAVPKSADSGTIIGQ